MRLVTYNDMSISIIRHTPYAWELIQEACDTTMRRFPSGQVARRELLEFLIEAEHTSVLEHLVMTVSVINVSRAFMAQITRHRMGSFTCSSQHYQTYNDYPLVVHPKYKAEFIGPGGGLIAAMFAYEDLMARDIPKEEARQTLPNAMAVNILWTVNARSLANFFRQRCCNRNTAEMQLFANRLLAEVIKVWPLFENVFGPPCKTGKCNQRHMQCAEGEWSNHESL